MIKNNNEPVETLMLLIESCKQSCMGYRKALSKIENEKIKEFFKEYAHQRKIFVVKLSRYVERLSGNNQTDEDYSFNGKAGWNNINEAIAQNNLFDILKGCKEGEKGVLQNYEAAVGKRLPPEIIDVVQKQMFQIREAHYHLRLLANSRAPK